MKKPGSYHKEIIDILQSLHKSHPSYNMGKHLSTALSEYETLWGVPDKEIAKALRNYQQSLEPETKMDGDIDRIIREGLHIYDVILDERDGEGIE